MRAKTEKKYPTIGCCGLDCGLCPRYYTDGPSRCPGCLGPDFNDKHPSCSFITCCVKQKGLEVCSECEEFPCAKFKGFDAADSFLSHKKVFSNMNMMKQIGVERFAEHQKKRMSLLENMLGGFNEGRSKSLFCLAATLLSILALKEALEKAERATKGNDIKAKAKTLRSMLHDAAERESVVLKLDNLGKY